MAEMRNPTLAYKQTTPKYGGLPQAIQFSPYMPNQKEMISEQLTKGFGSNIQDMFGVVGQGNAEPINVMKLREPISQTMDAFGLRFNGQPGGSEVIPGKTFNPNGYQQWGVATGQPYIDQMFGLRYMPGETIPADAGSYTPPAPPAAPPAAPKKDDDPYPMGVPMNRDDAERLTRARIEWEQRNGKRY